MFENYISSSLNEKDKVTIKKDLSLIIGRLLYRMRKDSSLTGKELAKKVGLSQQQISRYENGINYITLDLLLNILSCVGVTIFEFFHFLFLDIKNNNYSSFLLYESLFKEIYENEPSTGEHVDFKLNNKCFLKFY